MSEDGTMGKGDVLRIIIRLFGLALLVWAVESLGYVVLIVLYRFPASVSSIIDCTTYYRLLVEMSALAIISSLVSWYFLAGGERLARFLVGRQHLAEPEKERP